MKKLRVHPYYHIREWLLLPFSIYEALTCAKPVKVMVVMEHMHEQNKIMPYRILMWFLEKRCEWISK